MSERCEPRSHIVSIRGRLLADIVESTAISASTL